MYKQNATHSSTCSMKIQTKNKTFTPKQRYLTFLAKIKVLLFPITGRTKKVI